MKNFLIILLLLQVSLGLNAQKQKASKTSDAGYFTNPILGGDNPDPSIICDGKDYYMVHSSFEYYPGLLLWHSKDLVHWSPVANALHKYLGSVYAPDLIKHDDKYFIYFPAKGTNYVVWAESIEGPWSEPIDLEVGNIDPGHITDEKGKRYLYFSNGGYVPLSDDGLRVTGPLQDSYKGWDFPNEWSVECFCLEGPKLVKHGAYYYLTVAEGGTAGPATGHMVVSARSKSPLGPWENSPHNPIARTKDKSEQWWSVGHATIFEDAYQKWWMVLHGYENGFYNMGRQTLLVPIEWTEDGWYKIPEGTAIDKAMKIPEGTSSRPTFSLSDNFDSNTLKPQWKFYKDYDQQRFNASKQGLSIKGKGSVIADCSPLLCVPSDHSYDVSVEMEIEGDAMGGLVLFYDEKGHSGILASQNDILANLRGWQFTTEEKVIDKKVFLQLRNRSNTVDMYYSLDGKDWTKIESSLEVSSFNHNALNGFLSLRIGLCAIGDGSVIFKNFKYTSIK